jgi:ADP-heptose:LPS heptosyltransferase
MKFSPANEIHEVEGCEPFVVFHPWAGGFKGHLREWQNEKWSMLAREMIGLGYHVVLTGAREEVKKNEEIVNTESPNSRGWMVNAAGLSLRRSLEMVRRASLVVSVNTGIMHVAAAIGAPLVALHGPTSIVRWGPIDENAINIVPSVPGHGYLNLGFEYPRHPPPCMEHIEYSRVRDACCEKLAAQGRVRPQSESCADVG